jgi:hypothetical protein
MPEDPAIPAEEVPANPGVTREFILDKENLQREQKGDVSPVLTTGAYLAVGAIGTLLAGLIAWGLLRLERHAGRTAPPAAPSAGPRREAPVDGPQPTPA